MNVKKVISELKQKYPDSVVIENKNEKGITTEVICELPNESKNSSTAIAVIDSSVIHYHKVITETYSVLKGKLMVFKYDSEAKEYKEMTVREGDSIKINPGEIHSNLGQETWVKVYSEPAWFIEDFINLDTILKKYTKRS